jgi:membrane protein
MRFIKSCYQFIKTVVYNFIKDDCLNRASSLAFTSLLGLVPLIGVGMYLLSFFPQVQSIGLRVQSFIFKNLVASSGETVEKYITTFSQQVLHMSWIGIFALIVVIVMLMFSIESTLNKIWKIDTFSGKYSILKSIGRHWLMLFFIPTLLGSSLVVSSYLATLTMFKKTMGIIDLPGLLWKLLPIILVFLAFTAIYKFLPTAKVKLRDAAIGGVVATILFQLSKLLFRLYIYFFPTYKFLYGAFAAIPLFLLWDYIVWLILLFAAEITWLLGADDSVDDSLGEA